jgi:hypothetical protein
MARKKTVKQDNVTLTSEEQENSVADITGTLIESPAKQNSPNLGQAQSLALRETEEEKPKPMAQEQPKELASITEQQIFDCMSFLNKQRLKPVFTNYGKKASCIIVDNNGNNVLPKNQVTNHSMIVYGDDKDRALINAVNAYKGQEIKTLEYKVEPPRPFAKEIEEKTGLKEDDEYGHPFEDILPKGGVLSANPISLEISTSLLSSLRSYIEAVIQESLKSHAVVSIKGDVEELKDKISELLRKL